MGGGGGEVKMQGIVWGGKMTQVRGLGWKHLQRSCREAWLWVRQWVAFGMLQGKGVTF
jgi:hypothetical protein